MAELNVVYLYGADHRQSKNNELVEKLRLEHNSALLRFVRVKAHCTLQEAEDIVQEVYVKLLRIPDLNQRVEGRLDTIRSFIFQIATNLLIDSHRRAQSRCQNEHDYDKDKLLISSLYSPERTHQNVNKLRQIEQALEQVRPTDKQAFLLHRIDGKSYREISDIMGVSVSTVEKYISAALLGIRKRVDKP